MVCAPHHRRAALKLMRKHLKKYGFIPDKLVTDDLRSYGAAAGHLGIAKRHERGRWRNNQFVGRSMQAAALKFGLPVSDFQY
jgi:putative transposase